MGDTRWHRPEADEPWIAARGLVCRLDEGNPLPVIELEFMGAVDEALHADLVMGGWWWGADENVVYEHRELLDFRGLGVLALTAVASAVGNSRRRNIALQVAAPQWRPVGSGLVRVLLTSQRMVLCADETAVSLWFDEQFELVSDLVHRRLELLTDTAPPFAIEGPWVPYLVVALTYRLGGEIMLLDRTPPPVGVWPPAPARHCRAGRFNRRFARGRAATGDASRGQPVPPSPEATLSP